MNVSNMNSTTLQNLVGLTKKKEALELQLEKIEGRIAAVLGGKAVKPAKASKIKTPATPKAGGKRGGKRGVLKEAIVALLEKAGPDGLSAKEISEKLGIPNPHVHVWFGTTGKKLQGLSKPAKGVWALKSE